MSARPVLLIDQDAEWYARVCRFLEPHGIPVVAAANVQTAAEQLGVIGLPSAVLMDITTRLDNQTAVAAWRTGSLHDVPVGYLKKEAALDTLLLMLGSSVPGGSHRAA